MADLEEIVKGASNTSSGTVTVMMFKSLAGGDQFDFLLNYSSYLKDIRGCDKILLVQHLHRGILQNRSLHAIHLKACVPV